MSDDEYAFDDLDEEQFEQLDKAVESKVIGASQAQPSFQPASRALKRQRLDVNLGGGNAREQTATPGNSRDETSSNQQQEEIAELKRRLLAKDGEISTIRRAKAQDDAKHTQTTQSLQEQLKRKDEEKKRMQADFKKDMERNRTVIAFDRQNKESEMARSRAQRRHNQIVSPVRNSQAAKTVSPLMQRTKSLPQPAFKGFKNAFVTTPECSSVIQEAESMESLLDNQPDLANGVTLETFASDAAVYRAKRREHIDALFSHQTETQTGHMTTIYCLLNTRLPPTASVQDSAEKDVICSQLCLNFGADSQSRSAEAEEEKFLSTLAATGSGIARLAALYLRLEAMHPLSACLNLLTWLIATNQELLQYYCGHARLSQFPVESLTPTLIAIPALFSQHASQSISTKPAAGNAIAQDPVNPKDLENEEDATELHTSLITFLDASLWYADETCLPSIELFVSNDTAMAHLLNPELPPELLNLGLNWVLQLAMQPHFFRTLVGATFNFFKSKIGLIDYLAYLVSHSRSNGNAHQHFRINMASLNFLGLLCVQHADALTLIGESHNIVASIVNVVYRDAAALYESIGPRSLPLAAHELIARTSSAVRLLLFVSASPDANSNLRMKFLPAKSVANIWQQFSVGFGRLAFSDPPEWLSQEDQTAIIELEGSVQAILDLVMSPDEQNSLYAVFGEEDEDERGEDGANDEEMALAAEVDMDE